MIKACVGDGGDEEEENITEEETTTTTTKTTMMGSTTPMMTTTTMMMNTHDTYSDSNKLPPTGKKTLVFFISALSACHNKKFLHAASKCKRYFFQHQLPNFSGLLRVLCESNKPRPYVGSIPHTPSGSVSIVLVLLLSLLLVKRTFMIHARLSGASIYRVSAGTYRPCVSTL